MLEEIEKSENTQLLLKDSGSLSSYAFQILDGSFEDLFHV